MAGFLLKALPTFPEGTNVAVYPASNWSRDVDEGAAPVGSSVDSGTVASGVVGFDGLAIQTEYAAYALVGGKHRYLRFRTPNAGATFKPEDFGAVGDGVTDDTAAFQACIDAAMASDVNATIELDATTYLLNSAPRTDRNGYCILSIKGPVLGSTQQIQIIGRGDRTVLKTTRTDGYNASFGCPSMIGGVTDENGDISACWTRPIRIVDVKLHFPESSPVSGIDAISWGGVELDRVLVVYGDGVSAASPHPETENFGVRTPTEYGFATYRLKQLGVQQAYAAVVLPVCDHVRLDTVTAHKCVVALAAMDPSDTTIGHGLSGGHLIVDRCKYAISGWSPTGGAISPTTDVWLVGLVVDIENPSGFEPNWTPMIAILDANNKVNGSIYAHHASAVGVAQVMGTMTGANKIRIDVSNKSGIQNIGSAATLTLPPDVDYLNVTGATTITSITAAYVGREVTLRFGSTAQVTDGGNLILNGNFTGGANRILKLVCDGTSWYEVSRSAN